MMKTNSLRVLAKPSPNSPGTPALENVLSMPPLPEMPSFTALIGRIASRLDRWKIWLVFLLLLSLWLIPARMIHSFDPMMVAPDQSDWLSVIQSLITFLMILAICWWLLERQWRLLGLPSISQMVLHFNLLTLCQQAGLYLFSFALLLLAVLGCLIALC